MTSRPPKRGGGLFTISGLAFLCSGPDEPELPPLRVRHPAGEVSGNHSWFSVEVMVRLGGWGGLELRSPCATRRSKVLVLQDGNRVRPGMTNVSSDERRSALVCVEGCL